MIIATPESYDTGQELEAVLMNTEGAMVFQWVTIVREATQLEWRAYAESLYPEGLPAKFLYAVHMACPFFYEVIPGAPLRKVH